MPQGVYYVIKEQKLLGILVGNKLSSCSHLND